MNCRGANVCVSVFGCMVVCRCLDAWFCGSVWVHGCVAVFACMVFCRYLVLVKTTRLRLVETANYYCSF